MKYKKIMIMLVLAVFIFGAANVCASDVDDKVVASEDTGHMELYADNEIIEDDLQTSEENPILTLMDKDETLSVQTDADVLGEDSATFSYLATEITKSGNIKLTHKNYICNGGRTINILEDNKVIDGDGAVIDMNGFALNAFYVGSSGVTIKNLTIKNVNGRAFYFSIGPCTFENCNFVNNYGSRDGGVIWTPSGTVTNCNFVNNTALEDGGAIWIHSGTVTNCNFKDNHATYGGAIRMSGNVTDCNFVDNTANEGGAILMGYGNVSNCNFTNNTGDVGRGGAVYFQGGDSEVTNSNFYDNTASKYGGAIYMSSGAVTNCSFINNKAVNDTNNLAGAVYISHNGDVTNCNFDYNYASRAGGAICMDSGYVTNCNFTNNHAGRFAGALSFTEGDVTNCNFIGNNATFGSAIYFHSASSAKTVSNSCFLNNRANIDELQVTKNENSITIAFTGQDNLLNAICSDSEVTFTNVTYWSAKGIDNTGNSSINLSGSNNEAGQKITMEIYDSADSLVENVTMITDDNGKVNYDYIKLNNGNYKYKAYHQEDYYYTYYEKTGEFDLDSGLGDFNRLQTYINGADPNSVLTLCRNYTFTLGADENLTEGILIDKPITIKGNGYTIDANGKACIFQGTGNEVILENITFKNANVAGSGGAVYFSQSGSIINCNFTGNNASTYGGAIRMYSGSVINCNFADNTAYRGGAIYFSGNGTVTNCSFAENTVSQDGGAIWMYSGAVTDCNFKDDHATYGGAVYFSDEGAVGNCNFNGNHASSGGAVYFSDEGSATNCNFNDNYASSNGGAIEFYGTGTVTNCNFTNNHATSNGGAMYFNTNAAGTVTNSNFNNNMVTLRGGAIYFNLDADVANCNFTGNNATSGSAIYFYSTSADKTIFNSCFLNNRANREELQVTKNENDITITFTGQDNLLNAIYSKSDAEVTFTNVTYWGAKGIDNTGSSAIKPSRSNRAAGQNMSVGVVVNGILVLNEVKVTDENGMIVLDISVGDNYYISVRHDTDSYYTDAEKIISQNMKYAVNVTSVETNSKTVNITAKSTIYHEFMKGQLVFILPDGTEIDANYASNGTWWVLYTFDDYAEYDVNASYVGLDNVTVNNATITITKADSTITLDKVVFDYGDSNNVTVTTEGATGITAKIDNVNVTVVDFTIPLSGLNAGTYNLTVTTIPDEDHNPVTVNATISINKLQTVLTGNAVTAVYNINKNLVITLTDAKGNPLSGASVTVNLNGLKTYTTDSNGQIKVSTKGLAPKAYTAKVTFNGNANYVASAKDIKVTVKKATPKMTAKKKTFKRTVKTKKYTIVLKDNTGKAMKKVKVTLKLNGKKTITAKTNSKGKATFKIKKLTKKGTYKTTVTFKGNKYYNKVVKKVKIKIK